MVRGSNISCGRAECSRASRYRSPTCRPVVANSLPARVVRQMSPHVIEWVARNKDALLDFWHRGDTWTQPEVNDFIQELQLLRRLPCLWRRVIICSPSAGSTVTPLRCAAVCIVRTTTGCLPRETGQAPICVANKFPENQSNITVKTGARRSLCRPHVQCIICSKFDLRDLVGITGVICEEPTKYYEWMSSAEQESDSKKQRKK